MMGNGLNREQRDALVTRIYQLESRLYPGEGAEPLSDAERPRTREALYATLGEYADRLPRLKLSVCPFCGEPLKRVFDPYGTDGPWWHLDVQVKYDEPDACEHFRVLLGALDLHGRVPREVVAEVRPGPEVPFVVPALLQLPGMRVVVASLQLATGDTAYPLAYFADQPTRPVDLHQPWLRNMFWFTTEEGKAAWSAANDEFDFELAPYAASGQLLWTDLERDDNPVYSTAEQPCPFVDLPGERALQQLIAGERELLGLPTGEPPNPFDA